MKIIGAGFARTGTSSLRAALEELGLGPCYHMRVMVEDSAHAPLWQSIVDGNDPDFDTIFADYQATVDAPACLYYQALMEKYPDAKLLLSVRDGERWYSSVRESIYLGYLVPRWMEIIPTVGPFLKLTRTMIWEGFFNGRLEDKPYAISLFKQHNEAVKKLVPAEKLLVFNVKEGWEPLCAFFDVPVPKNKPFPHLNDKKEMRRAMQLTRLMGYALPVVATGIIGLLVWGLSLLF